MYSVARIRGREDVTDVLLLVRHHGKLLIELITHIGFTCIILFKNNPCFLWRLFLFKLLHLSADPCECYLILNKSMTEKKSLGTTSVDHRPIMTYMKRGKIGPLLKQMF